MSERQLAAADDRGRVRYDQMQQFRQEARRQAGGRVRTEDEVRALVADAVRKG